LKNLENRLNIRFISLTYFFISILAFCSCTESARQSREPRINYDSLASSIPKSDTLIFLNKEILDTNAEINYVIKCNYPELIHYDKEIIQRKVNYIVLNKIKDIIEIFKLDQNFIFSDSLNNKPQLNNPTDLVQYSYLDINYNIVNNSRNLMSLIFNIEQFNAFSAHPITYHKSMNFDMNTGELIELEQYSVILQDTLLLNNISSKSFEKLKLLNISDSTWIYNGTLPLWENFKNYNLKDDSLLITFDVYQVAPFAVGPVRISIPWEHIITPKNTESKKEE
jgi:hypothetical protein